MPSWKRLEAGCALHDFAHERVCAYIRKIHPVYSDRQIKLEACRRFLVTQQEFSTRVE
jgi:hypothetical protein